METKLSKLLKLMETGHWREALALAARFPNLGQHRNAIKDAHEAFEHPRFFEQIGKNPHAVIQAGVDALKSRYLR